MVISGRRWSTRCTYDEAKGNDIRREVDTGGSVRLGTTPHWIAQSDTTDIQARRYHRAHLKITNLGPFNLNSAIGLLIVVDKNVVGV